MTLPKLADDASRYAWGVSHAQSGDDAYFLLTSNILA